jgi:hypothetical protein
MEGLSTHHLGAMLINDRNGSPVGVVSKTDLMIAYKHGIAIDTPAKAIMNSPVHSCDHNELLAVAVQKIIFSGIHRSFVHKGGTHKSSGPSVAIGCRQGAFRVVSSLRDQSDRDRQESLGPDATGWRANAFGTGKLLVSV